MKIMKGAFGDFYKISYEMTTSVRFCLSYDSLKWDCIHNVNEYAPKCYNYTCGHVIFMTWTLSTAYKRRHMINCFNSRVHMHVHQIHFSEVSSSNVTFGIFVIYTR